MNTPMPSPLAQSITDMSELEISSPDPGPTYRDMDTEFPAAKDLSSPNRLSPPLADLVTDSFRITESPPLLNTSVSQATDSEPLDTPYPVDVLQGPQHRAIHNLLREHGVAPINPPPITENPSRANLLATADSVEPTKLDTSVDLGASAATDYLTSDSDYELGSPRDIQDIPPMTTLPESADYFGQVDVADRDKSAKIEEEEGLRWIEDSSDDEQDMPALDQYSSGEESDPPTPALSGSSIPSPYSLSNAVDDVPSRPPLSRKSSFLVEIGEDGGIEVTPLSATSKIGSSRILVASPM